MEFKDFKAHFADQFMDDELPTIDERTPFRQLSSWDSLTGMAIMAMIEDEYSVKVSTEEFKSCQTVGEIFALVKSKSVG